MELAKLKLVCECGKEFRIRPRGVAGEMICPACNRRIAIPSSPDPTLRNDVKTTPERKWSFDLKHFVIGLAMTVVGGTGGVVFFWCINAGTTGRGMIYLPVFSLVFLVIGLTFLTKGLFGDLIELD